MDGRRTVANRINRKLRQELEDIDLVAVQLLMEGHDMRDVCRSTQLSDQRVQAVLVMHALIVEWELERMTRPKP